MPSAVPAMFMPRPAVSRVILTSTDHFSMASHNPDFSRAQQGDLGLLTIAESLTEQGFDLGRLSITKPKACRYDVEEKEAKIVDAFRGIGAAEEGAIIGIQVPSTRDFYKFPPLSRLLRRAFPGATIIAGGAHFVRDRIEGHSDPVESALLMGLADAVQVGHARAFVDLIVKCAGSMDGFEGPGFYRLDPVTRQVLGNGEGEYPVIEEVPYDFTEDRKSVHVLFSDVCRNGCDYCTCSNGKAPFFTVDAVIQGMREVFSRGDLAFTVPFDPNPFDPRTIEYYEEVFAGLDAMNRTFKSMYLEAGALLEDGNAERAEVMIMNSLIWFFFAGRDHVTEEGAKVLGRRYHGRVKDQKMLDGERAALMNLVRESKGVHREKNIGMPREMTVSYIVTHMETRDTALAMHDDMQAFLALDDPRTFKIDIAINPLMPYYGIRVRNRFKDGIDLGDMDFYRDAGNRITPWKRDAGPGVKFMREVAMMEHGNGARAMVDNFKKAIDRSF